MLIQVTLKLGSNFVQNRNVNLPVGLRKTRVMAQSILPEVQPAKPETHHLQIDYQDLRLPN